MINFLNPKIESFALDISDLSLKIINFKKRGRVHYLSSFGEVGVDQGIIEDGEIRDEKALAETIKRATSSIHGKKLDTRYVVISLPEEKSFLQTISLPKLPEAELNKAVMFEAENYIPMPSSEMYIDFKLVKQLNSKLDHVDALIGAIPKKIADSYVASVKLAGLLPVALEVESQAISRALIKNEISQYPKLLIDLGATRTSFIIYSGNSIRFTASIPVTSHQFTRVISEKLGVDLEKAEELKQRYGLESRDKVSFKKKAKGVQFEKELTEDKRILNALVPSIISLTKEIKKYLGYYQTHKSHEHSTANIQGSVREIVLCGGGANLKGLARILALELEIPTEIGNPWINVLTTKKQQTSGISFGESLRYTTAIGLALRNMNGE